jgi:hypothetical protein
VQFSGWPTDIVAKTSISHHYTMAALLALLRMFLKVLFYFSVDASSQKPWRSLSKRLFQYLLVLRD